MDPTYELISEQTISSNQSSVTFSNIPSYYKDLYIFASTRCTDTTSPFGFDNVYMTFNNNSSNYSVGVFRNLDGSTSTTTFSSNFIGDSPNNNATANTYGIFDVYIPNYSSSNHKSFSVVNITESNTSIGNDMSQYYVGGLWSNNEPINSIRFTVGSGDSFTASSSFYLYGIKNADDGSRGYFGPAARGGDEVYTTGDGYKVHVFKTSGTLEVTSPGEVEYLVVAGGGGAGATYNTDGGGGGGAGGLKSGTLNINSGSYNVIVGAGGSGQPSGWSTNIGSNGNPTFFNSVYVNGGGAGGGQSTGGGRGGSGGGAGGAAGASRNAGTKIIGEGNDGGATIYSVSYPNTGGSGGGGAGSTGQGATTQNGGNGGVGVVWPSGASNYYAGGGGGGAGTSSINGSPGSGGLGGGGNGAARTLNGNNATSNTGGGGGGSGSPTTSGAPYAQYSGGNGGSGIVIIRYKV